MHHLSAAQGMMLAAPNRSPLDTTCMHQSDAPVTTSGAAAASSTPLCVEHIKCLVTTSKYMKTMCAACVSAARLAFKVPALAAASNEELQEHMNTLEQVR